VILLRSLAVRQRVYRYLGDLLIFHTVCELSLSPALVSTPSIGICRGRALPASDGYWLRKGEAQRRRRFAVALANESKQEKNKNDH